ncbi:Antitoxin MazE [compost metagenome]|uniref:Antitoxin MazE n=1 Tax=Pseudomonas fluorescens TaxID=294 RepID=A0A5E7USM6_PSEFL|nr:PbsX family transcriptional regulator [Pseudomonas fluorescens]VVQ13540.1 Antitoxin MazE [Pseudomonas fluorescens]
MKSNIKKWGSSLALRLPASVLDGTVFELDLEVDVRVEGNRMIIELVRPPIDLDAMLTAITPENSHELIDWGPPVGKEVW